jgi:hypothetical protein
MPIEAIHEGGSAPPRLRLDLNAGVLLNLPAWSAAPKTNLYASLRDAGYEGLQAYAPEPAALEAGLKMTGMARILASGEVDGAAARHKDWGFEATTLHVGFETEAEMDALAAAVLEAQSRHGYPLFLETHRATMTQDMRRTLDLIARFPDLRFNADLSHWYTGQEMTYGDIGWKLDQLAPVFSRVRFLHGRIGNACTMQTPLAGGEGPLPEAETFRDMWRRCFEGFLAAAGPGDVIVFAPELLPDVVQHAGRTYRMNYARRLPSGEEETDRWAESLALCDMARAAFDEARRAAADPRS